MYQRPKQYHPVAFFVYENENKVPVFVGQFYPAKCTLHRANEGTLVLVFNRLFYG